MPWCAGRAVAPLEAHQAAKSRQSRGVGRPGRQRLLRLGVGHGGVDLGGGERARQLLGYDEGKVVHGVRVPEGQFIARILMRYT